jgi:hypothetical protein
MRQRPGAAREAARSGALPLEPSPPYLLRQPSFSAPFCPRRVCELTLWDGIGVAAAIRSRPRRAFNILWIIRNRPRDVVDGPHRGRARYRSSPMLASTGAGSLSGARFVHPLPPHRHRHGAGSACCSRCSTRAEAVALASAVLTSCTCTAALGLELPLPACMRGIPTRAARISGVVVPSPAMPSTSTFGEPIIQSMWTRLRFAPWPRAPPASGTCR